MPGWIDQGLEFYCTTCNKPQRIAHLMGPGITFCCHNDCNDFHYFYQNRIYFVQLHEMNFINKDESKFELQPDSQWHDIYHRLKINCYNAKQSVEADITNIKYEKKKFKVSDATFVSCAHIPWKIGFEIEEYHKGHGGPRKIYTDTLQLDDSRYFVADGVVTGHFILGLKTQDEEKRVMCNLFGRVSVTTITPITFEYNNFRLSKPDKVIIPIEDKRNIITKLWADDEIAILKDYEDNIIILCKFTEMPGSVTSPVNDEKEESKEVDHEDEDPKDENHEDEEHKDEEYKDEEYKHEDHKDENHKDEDHKDEDPAEAPCRIGIYFVRVSEPLESVNDEQVQDEDPDEPLSWIDLAYENVDSLNEISQKLANRKHEWSKNDFSNVKEINYSSNDEMEWFNKFRDYYVQNNCNYMLLESNENNNKRVLYLFEITMDNLEKLQTGNFLKNNTKNQHYRLLNVTDAIHLMLRHQFLTKTLFTGFDDEFNIYRSFCFDRSSENKSLKLVLSYFTFALQIIMIIALYYAVIKQYQTGEKWNFDKSRWFIILGAIATFFYLSYLTSITVKKTYKWYQYFSKICYVATYLVIIDFISNGIIPILIAAISLFWLFQSETLTDMVLNSFALLFVYFLDDLVNTFEKDEEFY